MLFLGAFLVGLISFYLSSLFKRGIYFFILYFATIVFNIELLSLFKGIEGNNIIILSAFEAFICHIIWEFKKRPKINFDFKTLLSELKKSFLEDKSLIVLLGFLCFLIGVSFILASLSPVNEPDAQGYHALRALFWAQDGFIGHFETSDIRCHCMPINSELVYTWIYALFKNDTVLGLLQFFSYFLVIFSGWKIMEIYEIDPKKRLWAIFIFSSLAGVISQMSSTQTDLTTGALIAVSFYLVLSYKKQKLISELFFASLAMALAMGTKSTGVIASLPLLIYYSILLKKDFLKYFGLLILNFIIFSSYNYILNFINYGNFLGATTALNGHMFWGGIKGFFANFIRYIFQFFDFSGFTLGFYINKYLLYMQSFVISLFSPNVHIGENVPLDFTNISMTEQLLGFGILGFTIFLPSSIAAFFDKKIRIFSILFWSQIIVLSFSIAYMIYSIRFIVTFMCLAIPIFTVSYIRKMNIVKFFIILFCFFYMTYASLFLSQRPMFYLKKEFIKTHDIKLIQENMRKLNYKFYQSFNESYTLKTALEPYCKNNNLIGIANTAGYMVYSGKFLELSNNCKINIINIPHIKNYDLTLYDYLVLQNADYQESTALNKNDIENPLFINHIADCHYETMDRENISIRLADIDEMKKVSSAQCRINPDFIKDIGFKFEKEFEAEIPKYLINRANETVKSFSIYKKVVKKY